MASPDYSSMLSNAGLGAALAKLSTVERARLHSAMHAAYVKGYNTGYGVGYSSAS